MIETNEPTPFTTRDAALEWDTLPALRPRHAAPDYPQRPIPRPRCCAKCQRGVRGMGFSCAYNHRCPNEACDHGVRTVAREPQFPMSSDLEFHTD